MQLLYTVGMLVALVLLWQLVSWLLANRKRLRVKLEHVPNYPEEVVERHPELGQVKIRPRDSLQANVIDHEENALHETVGAPFLESSSAADEITTESTPTELTATELTIAETTTAESTIEAAEQLHAEPSSIAAPEETTEVMNIEGENSGGVDDAPILLTPAFIEPSQETQQQQDLFADEVVSLPHTASQRNEKSSKTSQKISELYGKEVEPVRKDEPVSEHSYTKQQEYISLYVVATQEDFHGESLLRNILSYGLRFGDMSLFHRHEQPTGRGEILFSMARAVAPGTFNLNTMTQESIHGVSFFLGLPGYSSILAYDIMVDTARRLAHDLKGEVLDAQQQPLTKQLAEHYRERVQEFERHRLMNRVSN